MHLALPRELCSPSIVTMCMQVCYNNYVLNGHFCKHCMIVHHKNYNFSGCKKVGGTIFELLL